MSADFFFPSKGQTAMAAKGKEVCETCPVRRACLDHAIATGERYGVWGGMSVRERAAESRRRRRATGEHGWHHKKPHGTRACYARGCRRPECRLANNAHHRELRSRKRGGHAAAVCERRSTLPKPMLDETADNR